MDSMRTPRWKLVSYALIILLGVVTALPNILTPKQLAALPHWWPTNRVSLGLDLRGGSHLVLEVDTQALLRERLTSLLGDARDRLKQAGIADAVIRPDRKSVV